MIIGNGSYIHRPSTPPKPSRRCLFHLQRGLVAFAARGICWISELLLLAVTHTRCSFVHASVNVGEIHSKFTALFHRKSEHKHERSEHKTREPAPALSAVHSHRLRAEVERRRR